MSKCFAVASGKGGVGKSVLTANLAAALAQELVSAKDPLDIINEFIVPALNEVGDGFEKKTLYLAYVEENFAALYVISGECDEQYRNGQWKYDERSAFVLHRLCVSPLFQNQGIGKTVLQHIEEQVKDMGYNSIRLDTFTENPFAQKLYLHSGYESRGYADWRKGRFDLMEKKL